MSSSRLTARVDWVLVGTVVALAIIGIVNLRSASSAEYGFSVWLGQTIWFGLGAGVIATMMFVHYKRFREWAYTGYIVVVLLLVAVLLFGTELNGSTRWLNLGVFSFQPSELLKLGVIVFTARYFHDRNEDEPLGALGLIKPAVVVGAGVGLVLLQPDLGTSLVILAIFFTMVLFEGVKWSTLLALVFAGLLALPFVWTFGLKEYQKDRVVSFLKLEDDAYGQSWQVRQSIIAFGSGGATGKGHVQGTQIQKGFVPEHENDFVAANWGEEHGFVGMAALLSLYLFLIVWCLRISSYAPVRFSAHIGIGFAAMVFWHTTVNVGMVTGVLPVVGLTLPFMSSGGSSLLTLLIGVGLVLNVSSQLKSDSA